MSCCSEDKKGTVKNESCCGGEKESVTSIPNETGAQLQSSCCSEEEGDTNVHSSTCSASEKDDTAGDCCSNEQAEEQDSHAVDAKSLEYRVSGMDCPSCAVTIEKGLTKLNEVVSAKVHYSTGKLQLLVGDDFSEAKLKKTITNLGFELMNEASNQHEKIYTVEGMDCGSCAKTIEKHLSNVAGVTAVQVNFSAGTMKVTHTNPISTIIKEVSKIGFQASPQSNEEEQKSHSKENKALRSIVLSGILIAVGFIGTYIDVPFMLTTILFVIAMVISGYKPVRSAFFAIKSFSLDMNVLMSAAAIGAAIIPEWFEGATVVWLFSLGIYLQNRSMDQTRRSIRGLMDLAPSIAWIESGGRVIQKPVEEVGIGEIIVVKPGDKIPLDGTITEGETSVNQAPITGEAMPVDKTMGNAVYAGTINDSGSIKVEVTSLVEDSTLSKIIHLVEEAQEKRAPTEAFIDKFASIYTPIVFAIALIVIVFPPLLGFGDWSEWSYKGLALLVVACPCALVISTPVAIVSAIGTAARHGVLIKGGTFLEKAGSISAMAFDKTGTLTEGKPKVAHIHPTNITEEQLLSIAVTLESYSTHPIAKTIVDYGQSKNIVALKGKDFKAIAGKGVQATIDEEVYYAGNPKLFTELHIPVSEHQSSINQLQQEGKTIVLIGNEQGIIGVIGVRDAIRTATQKTMTMLKEEGIKQVVMLTGDNEGTAKLISKEANVNRYFAELLPEDKVRAIEKLQAEGHKVAMVGDGINDAPALATSDLGIAMGGTGTDTAMDTADIVLMADNLKKLPYTMNLSKKAITIIKQNIWFSLLIKAVALALIFPGWLTLWMAVLSDSGAAIIVILNSLRLIKKKKDKSKAIEHRAVG